MVKDGKPCAPECSRPAGRGRRPWTPAETQYLRQHRADGSELIAHVLGRSARSVQCKAQRMGVSLTVRPGEVCPECGAGTIREGTVAARHRMCIACWERRKTEAMREAAAEERARQGYNAAKGRKTAASKGADGDR